MKKRLRRMLPVRRMYLQASERAVASGIARHSPDGSVLLFYLWSAIPGWPHFARGQQVRAHLFLWGYLFCLIPGLLLMGSTWGSIWIGLAFSIHSSAIADLVNQQYPEAPVGQRMLRGLAVSAVLFGLIYWPVGYLISQVAAPYHLEVSLRPFEIGDVVIASSIHQPRVGDVVLYDVPDARGLLTRPEGMRLRVLEGRNIDRILAGPGASVECRSGRLIINGVPASVFPLNLVTYAGSWKDTMPAGHYFILPSDGVGIINDPNVFRTIACVPQEAIVGRVYLRTQPLSRFSIIR